MLKEKDRCPRRPAGFSCMVSDAGFDRSDILDEVREGGHLDARAITFDI